MKITWLGHSCFRLEQDDDRIVLDPYQGVAGYPDLQVQAHEVLCSHQHFDHNFTEAVTLLSRPASHPESPFSIRTVSVFHDDQNGALRGENKIHILTADQITVAHLGDLGHLLSNQKLSEIGPVDILLIPVGGFYTINAAEAKAVCDAIQAPYIIPMHYRHAPYGLPEISGVEDFLAQFPAENIQKLSGNSLDTHVLPSNATSTSPCILVPTFQEEN